MSLVEVVVKNLTANERQIIARFMLKPYYISGIILPLEMERSRSLA
jgi:hypothetical protein